MRQKTCWEKGLCLDKRRIGTENVLVEEFISRYEENWDRKRVVRRVTVWIQGELGQKTCWEKSVCLDTGRIGTENVLGEEFMFGYKENRDRKRVGRRVYVWIQGESGQKTCCEKSYCLDTGRIGTETVLVEEFMSGYKEKSGHKNEYREGFMSRYKENRDRNQVQGRVTVPIQGESRQKPCW
ncbi:hypothetical protein [Metabacillus litoralis]|uniref:hypothetical protein n=1 Tax=Metabacillus litoralis TaxID=152268 RepID=UPI002040A8C6|nr:hypothetical protein [Metabacillus litoralis]MCM3160864.1 hypothetical protein [Metabacillus litoralis]